MTSRITSASANSRSIQAGFTLAEMLLASVLGAMLLTALSISTFGFAATLEYHEKEAGINNKSDPALRRITRDVREAWWANLVNSSHLEIAAPDGAITEYYLSGSDLMVKRPNGDTGVMLDSVESLLITPTMFDRNREGESLVYDSVWKSLAGASGTPIALKTGYHEEIAIAFVAPADQGDVFGMASADEQVLGVASAIVQLPVAWIPGSGAHQFELSIYESWGPGSSKPLGNPLALISLAGASLPQAVLIDEDNDLWEVPTTMVPLSIAATLEPGVGYVLLLDPQGDSEIVVQAEAVFPSPAIDDVAMGDAEAVNWVVQPMVVPGTISGPFLISTTATQPVISSLTFHLTVVDYPTQVRSASLLSQVMRSDDPWLGTVPGQVAP